MLLPTCVAQLRFHGHACMEDAQGRTHDAHAYQDAWHEMLAQRTLLVTKTSLLGTPDACIPCRTSSWFL